MANIADLIANRNQELEDFKQKKQEERTEAYERRDAAVMEVTSDPEKYRAFLDLHAQTMYNAANTATVWKQRPGATQLLPRKKWAELGRKIREDETPVQVFVPFPVSWTVKMKKKQKETQDILSYHTQAAGCSDKARAKASGGRQPIEECGRTGL